MRGVQHHLRLLAEKALGTGLPALPTAGVAVAFLLVLVGVSTLVSVSNLSAATDERLAQSQAPRVAQKTGTQKKPESGELQNPSPELDLPGSAAIDHVPTKPPQVIYDEGLLTIIAENASLSEVLAAVRGSMGADIDLPPGASVQRIWVHFGPGPARKVLRDLLDSTEFNYVIQASEDDPDGVRSVLLTPRNKGAESGNVGIPLTHRTNRNQQAADANLPDVSEQESSLPVAVTPAEPSSPAPTPATSAPTAAASNLPTRPAIADPGSSKPAGSSSDQMIQQLQSMYEQRRQMQIQQNQGQKPQPNNR